MASSTPQARRHRSHDARTERGASARERRAPFGGALSREEHRASSARCARAPVRRRRSLRPFRSGARWSQVKPIPPSLDGVLAAADRVPGRGHGPVAPPRRAGSSPDAPRAVAERARRASAGVPLDSRCDTPVRPIGRRTGSGPAWPRPGRAPRSPRPPRLHQPHPAPGRPQHRAGGTPGSAGAVQRARPAAGAVHSGQLMNGVACASADPAQRHPSPVGPPPLSSSAIPRPDRTLHPGQRIRPGRRRPGMRPRYALPQRGSASSPTRRCRPTGGPPRAAPQSYRGHPRGQQSYPALCHHGLLDQAQLRVQQPSSVSSVRTPVPSRTRVASRRRSA